MVRELRGAAGDKQPSPDLWVPQFSVLMARFRWLFRGRWSGSFFVENLSRWNFDQEPYEMSNRVGSVDKKLNDLTLWTMIVSEIESVRVAPASVLIVSRKGSCSFGYPRWIPSRDDYRARIEQYFSSLKTKVDYVDSNELPLLKDDALG
jgi:hypothetical protein